MADKRITDLPELVELHDDSLLVAEHNKTAYKLSGEILRRYVEGGVLDLEGRVNELSAMLAQKGDSLEFDDATSLLWLTSNGERIGDGVKVATSGGGGAYAEVVENLPAPSENQRGKFLLTPNGDTDVLYICMRINGICTWAELEPKVNVQITTIYLVDANGTRLKTADGMYLAVNE